MVRLPSAPSTCSGSLVRPSLDALRRPGVRTCRTGLDRFFCQGQQGLAVRVIVCRRHRNGHQRQSHRCHDRSGNRSTRTQQKGRHFYADIRIAQGAFHVQG